MSYLWNICDFTEVPDTILSLFSPFWNAVCCLWKGGPTPLRRTRITIRFPFTYFERMNWWTNCVEKALITWRKKCMLLCDEAGSSSTLAAVEGWPLWYIFCDVPGDHVQFKCFFSWILFFIYVPGPCAPTSFLPSHQRSPCVRVPHLCFGCCADGSLLVLHNGSKVTVPHAINTHSNFSTPAVSFWSL